MLVKHKPSTTSTFEMRMSNASQESLERTIPFYWEITRIQSLSTVALNAIYANFRSAFLVLTDETDFYDGNVYGLQN